MPTTPSKVSFCPHFLPFTHFHPDTTSISLLLSPHCCLCLRVMHICSLASPFTFFKKKYFIYLFLERGERREKERERNISVWLPFTWPPLGTHPTTQTCALTGNRTSNPLVLRLSFNPLSHTSQGPSLSFI